MRNSGLDQTLEELHGKLDWYIITVWVIEINICYNNIFVNIC